MFNPFLLNQSDNIYHLSGRGHSCLNLHWFGICSRLNYWAGSSPVPGHQVSYGQHSSSANNCIFFSFPPPPPTPPNFLINSKLSEHSTVHMFICSYVHNPHTPKRRFSLLKGYQTHTQLMLSLFTLSYLYGLGNTTLQSVRVAFSWLF